VVAGGTVALLRQFIGRIRDRTTVAELLASLAPEPLRRARAALIQAGQALAAAQRGEPAGLRYVQALAAWGDAGGYDAEVLWDTCTTAALGLPFDRAAARPLASLSGGEQKRLALEALLRGDADVLLLDEPDNYLDLAGKRWLEQALRASPKTVLYVSHDRELLANTATKVVTVEARATWSTAAASRPGRRRARNASPASTSSTAATGRSTSGWSRRCGSSSAAPA
jgi:ATPase subunit of ABC transporter with duplicated ATPase domains